MEWGSPSHLLHLIATYGRVLRTIKVVDSLLHYDVLYLGGGNAQHHSVDLPGSVRIDSNDNGSTGGIHSGMMPSGTTFAAGPIPNLEFGLASAFGGLDGFRRRVL